MSNLSYSLFYFQISEHPLNAFPRTIPFPNYYYLYDGQLCVAFFTGSYDHKTDQKTGVGQLNTKEHIVVYATYEVYSFVNYFDS